MRAASLLIVLLVARVCALWGQPLPHSAWTPVAYVWQDIAVAFAFAGLERRARPPWIATALFWIVVAYAAINVPITRVLSSPLTMPMLRAAGGTLSDSIRYYATPASFGLMGVVVTTGAALAASWRRRWTVGPRVAGVVVCVCVAGGFGASRIETRGLDRNAVTALVRTALPRVFARSDARVDWRTSPFAGTPEPPDTSNDSNHSPIANGSRRVADLASLRGIAAGRNVLLVILESTAAEYLRPYGAREDPTPRLTALAESSLVVDNAYTSYPESIKGMTASLASRYPAFDVSSATHARLMSPSLATVLGAQGYATALFHSGRFMYLGMDTIVASAGYRRLEDAGDIGGNRTSAFGIDEAAAVTGILRWIDSIPQGTPFFVTYLPIAGHHPYAYSGPVVFPPDQEINRYRNALHEGDASLGTLLDGLRQRGLYEHTLIVVIGDHGEAFGQHPGNYGHTLAIYEENVHVPLVLGVPGAPAASGHVARVASLLDLPPTILDLLGLRAPAPVEGTSILAPGNRMALFFTDYALGLLGLRDGCITDIYEIESGRSRMFDVCADPDERDDIAGAHSERVIAYRDWLRRWSAAEVAHVTGVTR